MIRDLEALADACGRVRDNWPCNQEDVNKDVVWILKRMDLFGTRLQELKVPDEVQTIVLINIGSVALSDLYEKVNSRKRSLIDPLLSSLQKFHDFCDKEGRNFPAYERTDQILNAFYDCIEFQL